MGHLNGAAARACCTGKADHSAICMIAGRSHIKIHRQNNPHLLLTDKRIRDQRYFAL